LEVAEVVRWDDLLGRWVWPKVSAKLNRRGPEGQRVLLVPTALEKELGTEVLDVAPEREVLPPRHRTVEGLVES
jgi:hypothetical protein